VAAIVTVITLVLGYALAYFLSRAAPAWRGLFIFLVIAPLMTGVIVRTYGWIVLLCMEGLVNRALMALGLVAAPLQLLNSEPTVIVALVHLMLPFMVFPIFSSLVGQDPHLVPAASTLGARSAARLPRGHFAAQPIGCRHGLGACLHAHGGSGGDACAAWRARRHDDGPDDLSARAFDLQLPLGAAFAFVLVLCQLVVIALYFRRTRHAG
jgi:putative spermidine/putrescine transport system permease protein